MERLAAGPERLAAEARGPRPPGEPGGAPSRAWQELCRGAAGSHLVLGAGMDTDTREETSCEPEVLPRCLFPFLSGKEEVVRKSLA